MDWNILCWNEYEEKNTIILEKIFRGKYVWSPQKGEYKQLSWKAKQIDCGILETDFLNIALQLQKMAVSYTKFQQFNNCIQQFTILSKSKIPHCLELATVKKRSAKNHNYKKKYVTKSKESELLYGSLFKSQNKF